MPNKVFSTLCFSISLFYPSLFCTKNKPKKKEDSPMTLARSDCIVGVIRMASIIQSRDF